MPSEKQLNQRFPVPQNRSEIEALELELSRTAATLHPGDRVRVEGFLARGSYQAGDQEIALQADMLRRL